MKRLFHDGQTYEADRIVKRGSNIIGYIGEKLEFAFKGILDFSLFQLEDGQIFDTDEVEYLKTENQELKNQLAATNADLAALMDYIIGQ
jgi:hypothetical protein